MAKQLKDWNPVEWLILVSFISNNKENLVTENLAFENLFIAPVLYSAMHHLRFETLSL